ncbi:MAG: hypothetical protein KDB14_04775 [Planctomycetales bacterium]|nr:hypothetical protein [Planctomycetales bacterium]
MNSKNRFASANEHCKIMDITPALAKEMLAVNREDNRRLRWWYVLQLAAAMRRGEWRLTSQGIGFDKNGNLNNAQHTLNAVIESGVTIRCLVVFGLREDSFEVTDIGMKRTAGDLLALPPRVAEVVRVAAIILFGNSTPSADQMKRLYVTGIVQSVFALVAYCGTATRYFSSAPMKLAAVITIMNGGDSEFVYQQYRALCMSLFDEMSTHAQALKRQLDSGKVSAGDRRGTLARGLRVFDKDRANITKIIIRDDDGDNAVKLLKATLNAATKEST